MIASTDTIAEQARAAAHLVARDLAERAAVAAQREEQDHEVLHAAAEHGAHHEPQRSRQVAELRRERRAHERPGAGDGGEVVAEHHPAVGGHEVAAVVEPLRGRRARGVERQHARRDERGVEAVRHQVGAARRDHEEEAVHRLAARERDRRERPGARERHHEPAELREDTSHGSAREYKPTGRATNHSHEPRTTNHGQQTTDNRLRTTDNNSHGGPGGCSAPPRTGKEAHRAPTKIPLEEPQQIGPKRSL